MRTYSERMAANNDGMDPDWKPEPRTPNKNSTVEILKRLIEANHRIISSLSFLKSEEFDIDQRISVTLPASVWKELRGAYEAVVEGVKP